MKKIIFLIIGIFSFLLFACNTHQDKVESKFKFDHRPDGDDEGEYPSDYMLMQRSYPNNNINAEAFRNGVKQTKLARAAAQQRSPFDWELKGPTNIGGRVTDVALHPNDMATMYVSTSVGGVFKTTDSGNNWSPIFDGVGPPSIGNLAIDPNNPETLYVGTGEANGSATSGAFIGDGIHRTTDGGVSWENIGLDKSQHIGRIVVDPLNSNRVFAAATGVLYGKNEERGVYRTVDGGTNWEQVLFVSDSTACIDVAINSQNSDIIYAAMWERTRKAWVRDYGE